MKTNTGIMLSEFRGPLKNLLDNLSGENGNYWLIALKKMLRKEKLPKLPPEALKFLSAIDSPQVVKERLEGWVETFKSIPSVHEATICAKDEEGDLININVFPNIRTFYYREDKEIDYPFFVLTTDFKIKHFGDTGTMETEGIYGNWCKDEYPDLHSFLEALIELSELYGKAVPVAPVIK